MNLADPSASEGSQGVARGYSTGVRARGAGGKLGPIIGAQHVGYDGDEWFASFTTESTGDTAPAIG